MSYLNSDIRRIGTEALVKALGTIGMARYLEEYYTVEKYEQQELTVEEILKIKI